MTSWVNGKIIKIKCWTENLFSIFVKAPVKPFIAGQFAKIKIETEQESIQRAYSYVNSPSDPELEFYIKEVKNGKLSGILKNLKPNDNILVSKKALGNFTISRIPTCKNLWMISTGTAIGPYISILRNKEGLERFKKIILVYAVRFFRDFSYFHEINRLQKIYLDKLHFRLILSQERKKDFLFGHIQDLISNKLLEISLQVDLKDKDSNHIMLCGNPDMIKESQKILHNNYNMKENFVKEIGQITKERYW